MHFQAFISILFGAEFKERILLNSPASSSLNFIPKRSSNSLLVLNLPSNSFFTSSFLVLSSL
ncbi:hypothetical protein CNT72_05750 [Campylobacter jejuni]|nr:hypothetical protein [Campylobacter jejuni]EAH5375894.1 hypothetical protein [Campylobacter jejuni]EAH5656014.1 hypothetical protein [Campylobacter jejuni]EAH9513326.1 hypothetical protein [Campylobacter jejuni]EAI0432232.1 hypothetical protein [Campylobacter jejuni]